MKSKKRWNWSEKQLRKSRKSKRYKCKCEWCINIPYRDRYGLTIKENLSL